MLHQICLRERFLHLGKCWLTSALFHVGRSVFSEKSSWGGFVRVKCLFSDEGMKRNTGRTQGWQFSWKLIGSYLLVSNRHGSRWELCKHGWSRITPCLPVTVQAPSWQNETFTSTMQLLRNVSIAKEGESSRITVWSLSGQ